MLDMKKIITGKTIAQCIKDGDIKVGDFVKVDRNVSCDWHEGVRILDIGKNDEDGKFSVTKYRDGTCICNCGVAQLATGLTIEVTRDGKSSHDKPTDTQAKRTFKDVSAKEQGIDTTRTFVVVSEIVGWPAKSYFPVGARLRLYRDDNTHAPDFCKEEDYTGQQNLDGLKYYYVPWIYLAYADEKVGMKKPEVGQWVRIKPKDEIVVTGSDPMWVMGEAYGKEGIITKVPANFTERLQVEVPGHGTWFYHPRWLAFTKDGIRKETAPEGQQTKQTIMNKLTSALKRALSADLQAQYKAGYINGGLELTSEGKEVLLDIAAQKFSAELTAAAKEKIAEEEKESE